MSVYALVCGCGVGPVDTSKDHKPWRTTCIDVQGNRVSYNFSVPATDSNAEGLWGVGITITAVDLSVKDKEALLHRKV